MIQNKSIREMRAHTSTEILKITYYERFTEFLQFQLWKSEVAGRLFFSSTNPQRMLTIDEGQLTITHRASFGKPSLDRKWPRETINGVIDHNGLALEQIHGLWAVQMR
jgi:hypothetical protein